ncbi:MAG: methyltransferase [Buchnera aphidicola (Tetraneura akinire)]
MKFKDKENREKKIFFRQINNFINEKTILSGNIQPSIINGLNFKQVNIFTTKFNFFIKLNLIEKTQFGLIYNKKIFLKSNFFVYLWPRNKKEALFQLHFFFSHFKNNTKVFIFGKNSFGVKSCVHLLKKWIILKKIDSVKSCSCFSGYITKITDIQFSLKDFFKTYYVNNLKIKSLPGIFDYSGIDDGTNLLASTFSKNIKGKVLDLGCGSGVLSLILSKICKDKISLTLIDSEYHAIISSMENFKINKMTAKIFESDLFSNIKEKFDFIISNPPIHENNEKITVNIINKIIKMSSNYLNKNGELRFVSLSCLSYKKILNKHFRYIKILKNNKRYTVYKVMKPIF